MYFSYTLSLFTFFFLLVSFVSPLSYLGISRKRSSTHDVESDDNEFVVHIKKTKISNIGKNLLTILLVVLIDGSEGTSRSTSQECSCILQPYEVNFPVYSPEFMDLSSGCSGSSVGRALAIRAQCRGFESHSVQLIFQWLFRAAHFSMAVPSVGFHYLLIPLSRLVMFSCVYTVDSPNSGHFGTTAFVLYLESVLYWGVHVYI